MVILVLWIGQVNIEFQRVKNRKFNDAIPGSVQRVLQEIPKVFQSENNAAAGFVVARLPVQSRAENAGTISTAAVTGDETQNDVERTENGFVVADFDCNERQNDD